MTFIIAGTVYTCGHGRGGRWAFIGEQPECHLEEIKVSLGDPKIFIKWDLKKKIFHPFLWRKIFLGGGFTF